MFAGRYPETSRVWMENETVNPEIYLRNAAKRRSAPSNSSHYRFRFATNSLE